jgi:hypothetical protein
MVPCQIADDGEWFDSWPAIMNLPQEERPMDMKFGDDTPISMEEKQLWTDCYDRFGIPIKWNAGDVAVVCNLVRRRTCVFVCVACMCRSNFDTTFVFHICSKLTL